MKVALFASSFHPHVGGVEEVVRQLALEQQRHGDHPLVVTNRWPKDLAAVDEVDGLPVCRYAFRVPEPNWRQMGGAALFGPSTLRQVCSRLRQRETEMIHVHCVSSNAYYALRAKFRLGLPLVVTLHAELTMDAGQLFQKSRFARRMLREVLSQADAITACSVRTLADAEAFFGKGFGAKGSVILNGVNVAEFKDAKPYDQGRQYILGMGRLVHQKGFDVLLRAFAAANLESCDLLIAGEGPEQSSLESLARDLDLTARVRFIGRVDHGGAMALLKGCLYFVLPSRGDEGHPIVNLEAMAAGKTIIASRTGGVPEQVTQEENGLLVERDNVASLANAMSRLGREADTRQRFEVAASSRAQQLSWSSIAEQYQDVYKRVCGNAVHRKVGQSVA